MMKSEIDEKQREEIISGVRRWMRIIFPLVALSVPGCFVFGIVMRASMGSAFTMENNPPVFTAGETAVDLPTLIGIILTSVSVFHLAFSEFLAKVLTRARLSMFPPRSPKGYDVVKESILCVITGIISGMSIRTGVAIYGLVLYLLSGNIYWFLGFTGAAFVSIILVPPSRDRIEDYLNQISESREQYTR